MIRDDITMDQYLALPQLSTHKLDDFASRGPRFFASRHVTRSENLQERKSEALIVGQAFEDRLCKPREWESRYAVKPGSMKFTTVDGKKWKADAEAAGKVILAEKHARQIELMVEAIHENDIAVTLIHAARQQVTITWDYPGIPGLCSRPDFLNVDGIAYTDFRPYSVDLKSTLALTQLSSGRAIANYGYFRQAALVYEGLRANSVSGAITYLLGVEKCGAHRAQVIELGPDWTSPGWAWVERQCARLASHYANNEWPRVSEEAITLAAPPWLQSKDSFDTEGDEDESESEAA